MGLAPNIHGFNRRSLLSLGAAITAGTGAAVLGTPQYAGAYAATDITTSLSVAQSPIDAPPSVRPPSTGRFNNPQRTMLATFQPGHGFTPGGTSSHEMNNTTDFVIGMQSATITTKGNGLQSIITKSDAITSFDMSGKIFAVLIKVTNTSHLARITLIAGSSNFANNFQIQIAASKYLPQQEIFPEGEWSWVTLPWAPSINFGSGSRSQITDLRIAAVDDNTGNLVTIQVQAIAAQNERPSAFANGVVSIGFDDCWGSQRPFGTAYLDRYGFQPTIYAIVDVVGQPGRLTLEDLHHIEDYSGGEVAGHAWTAHSHNLGFTALSGQEMDDELRLTKQWLLDNNFQGHDLFAYPLGKFNAEVMQATSRYFRYARTVNSRQQETLPPGRAHACRAKSSTNIVTGSQIIAAVDSAAENGTWLNLLFHDIVQGPALDPVQVTQSTFQEAIDYIARKGIAVRTVSQILEKLTQ